MARETINIVNNQSPLQPKGPWTHIRRGLLVFGSVAILGLGYLTYSSINYAKKIEKAQHHYIYKEYPQAQIILASTLTHKVRTFPWIQKHSTQEVDRVIDYLKFLEEDITTSSKKKIQQSIEEVLFTETPKNIVRISSKVGANNSRIEEILKNKQTKEYVQKIEQAEQNTNIDLTLAEKGLMLKILLAYRGIEEIPFDQENYYECKAEQLLYSTSTKEQSPSEFAVENLYFQAINDITEQILYNEDASEIEGEVLRLRIEEINQRSNNISNYIRVLEDVKSQTTHQRSK